MDLVGGLSRFKWSGRYGVFCILVCLLWMLFGMFCSLSVMGIVFCLWSVMECFVFCVWSVLYVPGVICSLLVMGIVWSVLYAFGLCVFCVLVCLVLFEVVY